MYCASCFGSFWILKHCKPSVQPCASPPSLLLGKAIVFYLQALGDTVVVISIVLGSAVTLFFVNTILADISKLLY